MFCECEFPKPRSLLLEQIEFCIYYTVFVATILQLVKQFFKQGNL